MTNPYNPIALKPIDYATPLQNVYAEQSSALDRYHAQLRERDRQEEAATLNLPEIFSKLASFSQSIASAKAAVEGLAVSIAAEFAPNIRVNCVALSLTNSKIAQPILKNTALAQGIAKAHPLKRIL